MSEFSSKSLQYSQLGASAGKEKLHAVLEELGALPAEGSTYFCQVVEDVAGSKDYYSVIHCDGAGTKTIIPYLWFRETGSIEYFHRLAADALVMNLDDVYCLGAPDHLLLANALARNSALINEDALREIIGGYISLGARLNSLGIPINVSGGETADCGDTVRSLVVDATLFARIKKGSMINPRYITPGDVIVSFASFGRASYEDTENSGIGSNGLTLARHALLNKSLFEKYPEIGNPLLSLNAAYQGPFLIHDCPEKLGQSIGDALSSPTRTYAPVLDRIFKEIPTQSIHGVIHLTGGAHSKVLRFCPDNCQIIKDNLFSPPPIFQLIQEHGNVTNQEMYKVFNMGQRMEIYCESSVADEIIKIADSFNIPAQISGHVNESSNAEVILNIAGEELTYRL